MSISNHKIHHFGINKLTSNLRAAPLRRKGNVSIEIKCYFKCRMLFSSCGFPCKLVGSLLAHNNFLFFHHVFVHIFSRVEDALVFQIVFIPNTFALSLSHYFIWYSCCAAASWFTSPCHRPP